MPLRKVLTDHQKEVIIGLINDHVSGQAALAVLIATDNRSEPLRLVAQREAQRAMSALYHHLTLLTEEEIKPGGDLSETAESQPGGPLGS